ncbi:MAG: Acetylglutamate kinase [Acidobacteria bacterium]|nr:Acetylglutamate kinase [Acidobacteriota bacterium]
MICRRPRDCWRGKPLRFVVKLGGSILEDASIRKSILFQIAEIMRQGHQIILVHGGGKSLNRRLGQMGLSSQFVGGLRVTDAETLMVAVMVLAGEVNKSLVAEMAALGVNSVGICGADAAAIICDRLSDIAGQPQGLGYVGKPKEVNSGFFDLLLSANLIPIVSSIAIGPDSRLYNINADQAAAVCAWGTGCEALVYLTDVPGVRGEDGAVCGRLGRERIKELKEKGILSGGMLPKTSSCLEALDHGVPTVYILPGENARVLLRFLAGTLQEGTVIHGND